MSPTPSIDRVFDAQRARRLRGESPTADERLDRLARLEKALLENRSEIHEALWRDLRKPPEEADLAEIYAVVAEARHARRNLRRWMRPRRVRTPLTLIGSQSHVRHEPKGVVLIISPWNFPFNLTLGPLVSALAAGNSAVLKPSEMTPASSACMARIIARTFAEDEAAVVEGDAATSEALLRKPFDHIFFTGSPGVGRRVMKAAAEHLTPVTLELGGKSPVIVEKTADLRRAARRVAWGKFINAGQICVAPDYVLVDEAVHDAFVAALRESVAAIPEEQKTLIVSDRHAERLNGLVEGSLARGASLVAGGRGEARRAPATVLQSVPLDAPVMEEEIFGPVLPVVRYHDLDEAIEIVASRPMPLVLYLFSRDRAAIRRVMAKTSSGATVINHTLIHFYQVHLPYGGVGESGMGRGHGVHGFETFSNARGVLEQRTPVSPIEWVAAPPYNATKRRLIDFILRFL